MKSDDREKVKPARKPGARRAHSARAKSKRDVSPSPAVSFSIQPGDISLTTERKKPEEALRESEERYRSLVELSPEAIFVSIEGKHVFVNSAAVKLLGASSPDQIVGKPATDFVHRDYREIVAERMRKAIETGIAPTMIEEKLIRFDGGEIDVEVRAAPLVYQGKPAMQAVISDITERKKAEENMRHLNLVLRAIRNVNQIIAKSADRDSLLKGVCESLVKTRGYYNAWIALLDESGRLVAAAESGLGKSFRQMIERLKRGELPDCGQTALKKPGVLVIEDPPSACIHCPLGKNYSGRGGMSIRLEYGGKIYGLMTVSVPLGVLGQKEEQDLFEEVAGDIAFALYSMEQEEERKCMEQALAGEAMRRRILMEQSVDGISVLDENGKLVEANKRFAEMLGYSLEEVSELHVWDWDTDHTREELLEMARTVDETGAHFETRHRRKDGTYFDVELSNNGVVVAGKKLIFCVSRDISERKKADEELKASEARYKELADSVTDVFFAMDRDLRYTYWNKASEKLLGIAAEDALGKYVYDIFPDVAETKAAEKVYLEVLATGRPRNFINEYKINGKEYWFEINAYPTETGVSVFARDISERKKAEEALRRSEKNFRDSIENSPLGVRVLGEGGQTIYTNRALLDMWGYSSVEELEAVPREQRFTAGSYIEHMERFEGRKRGEVGPLNYESSIVRSDGEVRHLSASVGELLWDGEKRFQVVYQDITQRKEAEGALRRSEQNFRDSIENSPLGIRVVDKDGKTLYANRALLDMWGYSSVEELEVVPEEQRYTPETYAYEHMKRLYKMELGEPAIRNYEANIVRSDGEVRHLSASVGELIWNGEKRFQIVYQDITQRKQVEEDLRLSREYLDRMLNSMVEILMVIDTDYNIIDINRSFLEYYGGKRKEIIGRKCYEVLHKLSEPCSAAQRRCPVQTVLKTKKPFYGEHIYATGEGHEHVFEVSMFPLMDSAGNIEAVVEMQHDITERKRAEEDKRQLEQKTQIASRLASVGEMAAGIAHEINNPLTSVIGYSQLLSGRKDIPEDISMDLKAIDEGAQRVAGIIKRLLTFARQNKPERTLVSIKDLLTNTLDLRAYHLKTNSIKVTTELAKDLPITTADAAQLQQVFLNIIVNAEMAMKLGRGKGRLMIKAEAANGTIRISFKDNGPGIARDNLTRIFDPFFTTREVGQGTGLGLSICHGIIAEHNGRIWAESQPGEGATFIVELPIIIESSQLEMAAQAADKPKKSPKAKVLVVDDEPATLEFLNRLLTDEGHEVETVSNAAEALEKVRNKRYRLILMDIKMPGGSGIELYGRMQKIAMSLTERVIFVTGDIMGTDTEAFLSRTKAPYITKPFDVNHLKKKIHEFLSGGK